MNTQAHLIVGAAAFGKPDVGRVTLAALIGAAIPDASLYVLTVWEMLRGTSPQVIFDELYFSDGWMRIFAIDNSLVLWGLVFALAAWRKVPWLVALAGSAWLHIVCDLPLHTDDARPHFWPISDWRFNSPISYWDPARGGHVIGALEVALCVALTVYILRRFTQRWIRIVTVVLCALEIVPQVAFVLFAPGQGQT